MCIEKAKTNIKRHSPLNQIGLAVLAGGALLQSPLSSASEQNQSDVNELEKVVISATRMDTDINDVTRPIALLGKKEIESMQPKSVAEIFRYQPNITTRGGPRSGVQSVNIRGLGGNKVLQLIDGVRQDFDSGHRPDYFLDPELLKAAEVVKGPTSSLWGSGAIGGVVSQSTVNADDLLDDDQQLGGFVKSGFNGNNDQSSNTAAVAGRTDKIDWLVTGYYRDSNDLKMGNGNRLDNSASRDFGFLGKTEWLIDDSQSLGINFRTADVKGAIPSNGAAPVTSSNFLINREQKTSTLSAHYDINTASPLLNAHTKIYWNQVDMDESRVSDSRADSTELDVYGFQLTNQSDHRGITLLYGFDGYREEFNANRSGTNRPTPPEAETDVWGAFLQSNIPLSETWFAEVGARYDRFSSESKNLNIDRSESEFSPSVALTWKPANWLDMTLRHDRAFRAPGSEELYTTGTHFCIGPPFGCNSFISNPNLKPESAANTELLAKVRFDNIFANDTLQINASVFQNKVDDFIEQVVTSPSFTPFPNAGTTTWQNVDKAELEGFEISTDYQQGNLRVKLAYGQVRGEDEQSGRYLSDIPADTLTGDLIYAFANQRLIAGIRVIDAETQSKTPDSRVYDGYTVTDIYSTWEPEALPGLKLGLNINNLTDQHYRRAFEELYEAGREVIVSARYDF